MVGKYPTKLAKTNKENKAWMSLPKDMEKKKRQQKKKDKRKVTKKQEKSSKRMLVAEATV